jgi:putative ABC transport system permease protein
MELKRAPGPVKLTTFLSEWRESLAMALNALAAHKLRSGLTLLGILVGVFSIIVVMTAMRVLQDNVEGTLSQLGANTFAIQKWPGAYFGGLDGLEKFWRRKSLNLQQGLQVKERATLALNVGFESELWTGEMSSRYEKSIPTAKLIGDSPGCFPAKNWIVADGRALIDLDVDAYRDVCVLGSGLALTLFPHASPIGERVKVNGINYSVIGVLEAKGALLGGDQDNFAIIPISTGLNRFGRIWRSVTILVQARGQDVYDDAIEQVRGILRTVRKVPPGKEDDFEVFSNDSLVEQFQSFTLTVRIGVAVVSSIALLAAGVGIMNIMLVSVTERTREIGIRRAIGAKRRHIITQFLMEAVVLCQIGGIIGVALGVGAGNVTAYVLGVPPVLPMDWVILGLLICSAVGIIFGSYPAVKAANLDPIESLRYE